MNVHWNLFIAFFRSGILGFGGGPSTIPLVHKEVVGTFKWLNDEEFSDVLALGNTLPGPIATKMAGYIGYKIGGVIGMITAILATILPTILLMLVILTFFHQLKNNPRVQGMTKAVMPIVGVMMAVLTWDFLKKTKQGWGWKLGLALLTGSFIVIVIFKVNPGLVIALLLIAALLFPNKKVNKDNLKTGKDEKV